MTFEQFNTFQAELIAQVVKMRDTKGKEYANSLDRFDNFNRLSQKLDIHRNQVLNVYFTKHMDAIDNYCKTGISHSEEGIQGRIVDAITYLTLLAGMIHERTFNADEVVTICPSCKYIVKNCICANSFGGVFPPAVEVCSNCKVPIYSCKCGFARN